MKTELDMTGYVEPLAPEQIERLQRIIKDVCNDPHRYSPIMPANSLEVISLLPIKRRWFLAGAIFGAVVGSVLTNLLYYLASML